MRHFLATLGLVILCSVVLSGPAFADGDETGTTDPIDPPGSTEPTKEFVSLLGDLLQHTWSVQWWLIR